MDDLASGAARGLRLEPQAAPHAIAFFGCATPSNLKLAKEKSTEG